MEIILLKRGGGGGGGPQLGKSSRTGWNIKDFELCFCVGLHANKKSLAAYGKIDSI